MGNSNTYMIYILQQIKYHGKNIENQWVKRDLRNIKPKPTTLYLHNFDHDSKYTLKCCVCVCACVCVFRKIENEIF